MDRLHPTPLFPFLMFLRSSLLFFSLPSFFYMRFTGNKSQADEGARTENKKGKSCGTKKHHEITSPPSSVHVTSRGHRKACKMVIYSPLNPSISGAIRVRVCVGVHGPCPAPVYAHTRKDTLDSGAVKLIDSSVSNPASTKTCQRNFNSSV